MIAKVKNENKAKAGFIRAEKYHQRNLDDLVKSVTDKRKGSQPHLTKAIVTETYNLFRERFTFFKK